MRAEFTHFIGKARSANELVAADFVLNIIKSGIILFMLLIILIKFAILK